MVWARARRMLTKPTCRLNRTETTGVWAVGASATSSTREIGIHREKTTGRRKEFSVRPRWPVGQRSRFRQVPLRDSSRSVLRLAAVAREVLLHLAAEYTQGALREATWLNDWRRRACACGSFPFQ